MNVQVVAAALSGGVITGGGVKWVYDRWHRAMVNSDEMPIKEIATTTEAAAVIAKAAGAVVVMLRGELSRNTERISELTAQVDDLIAQLEALHSRERTCHERLEALEAQIGGIHAAD
jgi:chaperonin cofactor prefoldin